MMKIENLYDTDGAPAPGSDWVFAGDGSAEPLVADATQVLNTGDRWLVRVDVGPDEAPPEGFEPGQEAADGGMAGWLPIAGTDRPNPDEIAPGVYLEVPGQPRVYLADLAPIKETPGTARNVKRLLARAAKQGAAGVVFRHPSGAAYKVRVG